MNSGTVNYPLFNVLFNIKLLKNSEFESVRDMVLNARMQELEQRLSSYRKARSKRERNMSNWMSFMESHCRLVVDKSSPYAEQGLDDVGD